MPRNFVEWGVAAQILKGENLSGDQHLIRQLAGRYLIAAIDGVGHGPEAAAAGRAAVEAIEVDPERPLNILFFDCHNALGETRGVVMTLAILDYRAKKLTWAGVGNVEGRLLRADKESSHPEETLLLRSGIIGHNLPSSLNITTLPIFSRDVLILATDGIRSDFATRLHTGRSAYQIANDVLARYSKGTDDALVVVAKYRGGESSGTVSATR